MLCLDAKTARHLILHLQGLTHKPHLKLKPETLLRRIIQLGFVQVDSIQWVERAHHMILFARNQTYKPGDLAKLCERDKELFENWTHDAAFIPSIFFPYWRHKFARDHDTLFKKFVAWQGEGFKAHRADLIDRILKTGPVMARDLEKPKAKQEMWQWHDGKAALEFLWRTGTLGIAARKNFQKCYDVIENCINEDILNRHVDHESFVDWACRSALQRLGFGSAGDIAHYWDLLSIKEVTGWLSRQKDIEQISLSGANGDLKKVHAFAGLEDTIAKLPALPDRIRALSPFDPVIRDRKRLSWLWGFDYTIEIYVPAQKRQWGYYVFPLLQGDTLIGRVDMRAERKKNLLHIRKVWLEPGIRPSRTRIEKIAQEFSRQARFCGVDLVDWNGELSIP